VAQLEVRAKISNATLSAAPIAPQIRPALTRRRLVYALGLRSISQGVASHHEGNAAENDAADEERQNAEY